MNLFRTPWLGLLVLALGCAEYQLPLQSEVDAGGVEDAGFDAGRPDAGDESDFTDLVCASIGRRVTLVPLDLLVLLDVSGSMDYDLKWVAVKSALKSFVSRGDLGGFGMGLQFFPARAQCRVDAYESPSVPIAPLPANSSTIIGSLEAQRMSGGTPTVPALQGAVNYVKAHLADAANAGHRAAIVLATDGMPDTSCSGADVSDAGVLPNSITNVAAVARAAASSSPEVKTFVVGVGSELGPLDAVADAGGTTSAVLVDVAGNADVQFLAALTRIRHEALGCDFAIPTGTTDVDLTKARIRFEPDQGGEVVRVPRKADGNACGVGQGWYFDVPAAPTKVLLCEATCGMITGGSSGIFRVEFACGVN